MTAPLLGQSSPGGSTVAHVTPLTEWEQLLSAYSASLDEHRSVLLLLEADAAAEHDVPAAPSFVPAPAMSPMPGELAPWARTLMGTTDALMQFAAELSARAESQLQVRPHRAPPAGRPGDATLDALL